jgi:hypothetical protein
VWGVCLCEAQGVVLVSRRRLPRGAGHEKSVSEYACTCEALPREVFAAYALSQPRILDGLGRQILWPKAKTSLSFRVALRVSEILSRRGKISRPATRGRCVPPSHLAFSLIVTLHVLLFLSLWSFWILSSAGRCLDGGHARRRRAPAHPPCVPLGGYPPHPESPRHCAFPPSLLLILL